MPPRKKTASEPAFPDESCGACHFCRSDDEMVRERVGICFAVPPVPAYDGDDITPARPIIGWSEFPCHYFRLRAHS